MNKDMTKERIQEIRELCEAVTPGEWRIDKHRILIPTEIAFIVVGEIYERTDLKFIAAARQIIPELLEALEEAIRDRDYLWKRAKELAFIEADRNHYKEMFETVIKKCAQVEAEREQWKARTVALEEAIVRINPCGSCAHVGEDKYGIQTCKLESTCDGDWEFDEVRFAASKVSANA